MRVKICGITRSEDAQLAVELGAWALGFVFHPTSARYLTPEKAAEIIRSLPASVEKVGVFVNCEAATIRSVYREAGLTIVQLHGEETPEMVSGLGLRTIKAEAPARVSDLRRLGEFTGCEALLVDSGPGGTGKTGDWEIAKLAKSYGRLVLAGGIHAGNVRAAVEAVKPWAVDLSSGVESTPGIKDAAKLKSFFLRIQEIGHE